MLPEGVSPAQCGSGSRSVEHQCGSGRRRVEQQLAFSKELAVDNLQLTPTCDIIM